MKPKRIPSLLLAVILSVISAMAAGAHTGNLKSNKPASPGSDEFIDDMPAMQTPHSIVAPEPPAIALIFAGALAFIGQSVLRRRAQL